MKSGKNLDAELKFELEQLKRNLVAIINKFIKSREGVTSLFRNPELTDDRIALAKKTNKLLMSKSTHDELIDLMQQAQLENADLSNKYLKQHSNHFDRTNNNEYNNSGLAEALTTDIDTINKSKGSQDRLTNNWK